MVVVVKERIVHVQHRSQVLGSNLVDGYIAFVNVDCFLNSANRPLFVLFCSFEAQILQKKLLASA